MASSRYVVDSAAPISIYPAGVQGSVTVLNVGEATVYVSDMASDLVGYPVGSGAALQWHAATPLYARIDAGADPSAILVNDTADVLPFAAVGVAGAVKTNSLVLLDTIDYPFFETGVLTVTANGSLVVTSTSTTSAALSGVKVRATWYRSLAGGAAIIAQDEWEITSSPSTTSWTTITLTVRGPYVRIAIEPTSVDVGVDGWTIDVYAQSSNVPAAYMTDGDGSSTVYDKYCAVPLTFLANGATYTWYPGVIAGRARLAYRFTTAAAGGLFITSILDLSTAGPFLFFRDTFPGAWAAGVSRQVEWSAPRTPVRILFENQSGVGVTFQVGLVYEGTV